MYLGFGQAYIFFHLFEPRLGVGIYPGMVLTPFPSSILDETRRDETRTHDLLDVSRARYPLDRTDALLCRHLCFSRLTCFEI